MMQDKINEDNLKTQKIDLKTNINNSAKCNSQIEPMTNGTRFSFLDEKSRLFQKINKVSHFWTSKTLLIPNVFKMTRINDEDSNSLIEYQDLSKKELLIQSNGMKAISSTERLNDS